MNLNFFIKRSSKEFKESKYKTWISAKEKLNVKKDRINKEIMQFRKDSPKLYRIKDRFFLIYPVSLILLVAWIIGIVVIFAKLNPILAGIVVIVYFIITTPILLAIFLAPTLKFFAFDMPKITNEIKVFTGNKYIIAVFFSENRHINIILKKIESDNMFEHDKGNYIVDKTAIFSSAGRVMLAFYIKNIPNPLKFNFSKYINEYLEQKKEDSTARVIDWEGKPIDVAFSSESLKEFKKSKLFMEWFRDYFAEANKIIVYILIFATVIVLIIFVMYILAV